MRDNAFIDACAQKNLPLLLQIMESGPIDPEIFSMVLVELGKEGFIAMCQSLLTKQGVDIETFSILAQFNNH